MTDEMAINPNTVEVLIAAAMQMLENEIRRLQSLSLSYRT